MKSTTTALIITALVCTSTGERRIQVDPQVIYGDPIFASTSYVYPSSEAKVPNSVGYTSNAYAPISYAQEFAKVVPPAGPGPTTTYTTSVNSFGGPVVGQASAPSYANIATTQSFGYPVNFAQNDQGPSNVVGPEAVAIPESPVNYIQTSQVTNNFAAPPTVDIPESPVNYAQITQVPSNFAPQTAAMPESPVNYVQTSQFPNNFAYFAAPQAVDIPESPVNYAQITQVPTNFARQTAAIPESPVNFNYAQASQVPTNFARQTATIPESPVISAQTSQVATNAAPQTAAVPESPVPHTASAAAIPESPSPVTGGGSVPISPVAQNNATPVIHSVPTPTTKTVNSISSTTITAGGSKVVASPASNSIRASVSQEAVSAPVINADPVPRPTLKKPNVSGVMDKPVQISSINKGHPTASGGGKKLPLPNYRPIFKGSIAPVTKTRHGNRYAKPIEIVNIPAPYSSHNHGFHATVTKSIRLPTFFPTYRHRHYGPTKAVPVPVVNSGHRHRHFFKLAPGLVAFAGHGHYNHFSKPMSPPVGHWHHRG